MTSVSKALGVPDNLRDFRNRLKGPMEIQPKKPASAGASAIIAAVQERVAAIIAQGVHRLGAALIEFGGSPRPKVGMHTCVRQEMALIPMMQVKPFAPVFAKHCGNP